MSGVVAFRLTRGGPGPRGHGLVCGDQVGTKRHHVCGGPLVKLAAGRYRCSRCQTVQTDPGRVDRRLHRRAAPGSAFHARPTNQGRRNG